VIEKLARQGCQITFFEATTALAFTHFRDERAALAVLETGLGGRLDSTNVVDPVATAITSIGFDHMEFLGDTLGQIAGEKAGILKPGVPAVLGPMDGEARSVIESRAQEVGAVLVDAVRPERVAWDAARSRQVFRWRGVDYALRLAGAHQAENAAIALELVRQLAGRGWEVRGDAVKRALDSAVWPARFEIVQAAPPLVLDGGHNREGLRTALETWRQCFGAAPGRIVFGCMKDKPVAEMLGVLRASGAELVFVPVRSPRSADPAELAREAGGAARDLPSVAEAHAMTARDPHPDGTLVLGSLYLAGEWMARHQGRAHQLDLN
jgi:dihydrofolate synthase/folylpolyglutamate synthase